MQSINLPLHYLTASTITAGDKDVRHYLNGVLVQLRPEHARIVATDGARMSVININILEPREPSESADIIIPRDVLKGAKLDKGVNFVTLTYNPEDAKAECRLDGLKGGPRVFKPIDGNFPDCRRVVPAAVTGEHAEFNWDFLAGWKRFGEELIQLGNGKQAFPCLHMNGDAAATVTFNGHPEFVGVIMPIRHKAGEYEAPSWLFSDDDVQYAKTRIENDRKNFAESASDRDRTLKAA